MVTTNLNKKYVDAIDEANQNSTIMTINITMENQKSLVFFYESHS